MRGNGAGRAAIGLIAVLLLGVAAQEDPERREVEEITVTAQKIEQSLQDVPISVTAISGDLMRELGANNLPSIAGYTPNVRFSSDTDPALAQVNIRGFGSSPLNSSFESSVGFVQDELFFARPTYFTEAIFDIDHVEVLRGPQGTLFGKNTSAGLFNVVSKSPTESFSGDIRTSFDPENEEWRVEAGAGGMFASWGGVRVSGMHIARLGELTNTKLDRTEDQHNQDAVRLKFLLLPMDDLGLEVTGVHSQTSITYWPLQLDRLSDGTRTYLEHFDPQVEDDPDNHRMSTNIHGYLDKKSDTAIVKADYVVGEHATFTWVNGYSTIFIDSTPDGDQSPADVVNLHVESTHEQWSSEPRIAARFDDGPFGLGRSLDVVAGVFFMKAEFDQDTRVGAGDDLASFLATDSAIRQISGDARPSLLLPLAGLGELNELLGTLGSLLLGDDSFNLRYFQETTTIALFGQAEWVLNDRLAVIPGVRLSREKKQASASSFPVCRAPPICVMQIALSGRAYDERLDKTEEDVSPKLALRYAFTGDLNVFASVARGYKSGGLNAASFSGNDGDLTYGPENVTSYELGIKSTWFDRRLSFNATAFYSDFQDLQVLNIQGAAITISNAATATAQGLEAEVKWLTPLEFLSVDGSLGLLRARYDSYPNGPGTIDQPRGSQQDLSDRPLTFAPDVTASLSPTVRLPLPRNLGLQLSVDALYAGDQYTNLDLDPNTEVDAQTSISARLILADRDGRWSVIVGGTNLTDVDTANQIVNTTLYPGTYAVTQKAGRAAFAAVTVSW